MGPQPNAPNGPDVLLSGDVFADLVFSGLRGAPRPGTETWAEGFALAPGGIANMAVAVARLGLRAAMSATFGDDLLGRWAWECLSTEGVDLNSSRVVEGGRTAVTASLAYDGDRAMVTHDELTRLPVDEMISPQQLHPYAVLLYLDSRAAAGQWWRTAAQGGTRVFADVAWDPSEKWDPALLDDLGSCFAFLPNEVEACAYTRTSTASAAAAALTDRVPVVVVTRGAEGAIAVDGTTGETADVPGLPFPVVDTTGAGDVFIAAFTVASRWDVSLTQRVDFAVLCASLSVGRPTGSLGAPSLSAVASWCDETRARGAAGDPTAGAIRRRYAFLDEFALTPGRPAPGASRLC